MELEVLRGPAGLPSEVNYVVGCEKWESNSTRSHIDRGHEVGFSASVQKLYEPEIWFLIAIVCHYPVVHQQLFNIMVAPKSISSKCVLYI